MSCKAEFMEIYEVIKGENAKKMYDRGDVDAGILSCGQGVGLVRDIPTIKTLFSRIAKDAESVIGGLAASI